MTTAGHTSSTVLLVYRYEDVSRYADHEIRTMDDRESGKIAGEMAFADSADQLRHLLQI